LAGPGRLRAEAGNLRGLSDVHINKSLNFGKVPARLEAKALVCRSPGEAGDSPEMAVLRLPGFRPRPS
jgi:hypothetical protein